VHCLRQHQEGTRHQEQEEVEVEQGLEEQEVREDAGAEAPAHSLQRQLPQLEGVQEGQPAVPTLSGTLGGESGRENHSNLIYNLIFEKINRYRNSCSTKSDSQYRSTIREKRTDMFVSQSLNSVTHALRAINTWATGRLHCVDNVTYTNTDARCSQREK